MCVSRTVAVCRSWKALVLACYASISVAAPLTVDVPEFNYWPKFGAADSTILVAEIEIRNLAADPVLVNTGLGSISTMPILPAPPTRQTVENDLRQFFARALDVAKAESNRRLVITIQKADVSWLWRGLQKAPVIGIFAVSAKTDFVMNLKVLLEIEIGGRVEKSYLLDHQIVIKAKATTKRTIAASYVTLIDAYRQRCFLELEERFVRRYF
jgi:hypothetical protein